MKTIYIITGVSGAGKSWVIDRIDPSYLRIKSDETSDKKAIELINNYNGEIVFLEKAVSVSTFIKRNPQWNFFVLCVGVDLLAVKSQIKNRGGKITRGLSKRWARMAKITEQYNAYRGSSEEVLKYIRSTVLKKSLVYCATSPSGKIYVGRTSRTLEERKADHDSDSKWAYKNNKKLTAFHSALIKHGGVTSFKWKVLASNLAHVEAVKSEQHHINKLNSGDKAIGYNLLSDKGEGVMRHSKDSIAKISAAVTAANNKSWKAPSRKSKARDEMLKQWKDSTLRTKRSNAIKKVRSSDEQKALTSRLASTHFSNPKNRDAMAVSCGAKPFIVAKDGEVIGTWINAAQCAKDLNLNTKTHISNCLHGRRKTYCGYTFRYAEIPETIDKQEEDRQ